MTITAFGFREEATSAAARMQAAIRTESDKLAELYGLQGEELAIVSLLLQHRSKRRIATLLEKTEHEVEAIRSGLMRRLGIRNVRDLVDLAKMTGLAWHPTPAQYLSRYVLPQLEGGRILGSVLKDRDWCGLIIRLRNGEQVTAWIDRDETEDCGGFLTLERFGENVEGRSTSWLRQATAEKVEMLIDLLDELDGDVDFESDEPEDEGIREAWIQPVSLGSALKAIQGKPNRKVPRVPMTAARRKQVDQLDIRYRQAETAANERYFAQQRREFAETVLSLPMYQPTRVLSEAARSLSLCGNDGRTAERRLIDDAWAADAAAIAPEPTLDGQVNGLAKGGSP